MSHTTSDTAICPVCDTLNTADSVYTHFKSCKNCGHVIQLREPKPPVVNITTHFDLDYGILIPGKKINYLDEYTVLGRYKLVLKSAYFNLCYGENSKGAQLWLAEQNGLIWVLLDASDIHVQTELSLDVADNIQIRKKPYNVVFLQIPEYIMLDGEAPNLPFLARHCYLWFLRPQLDHQLLVFQNAKQKNKVFQLIPLYHE
ncbi:MAG: hypothetical protein IT244_04310 [Bacteroidia bacterium]|nr:hypothetical protein [Bacteroidia bacterium]